MLRDRGVAGRQDPVNSHEPASDGVVGVGFRTLGSGGTAYGGGPECENLDAEAERVLTDVGSKSMDRGAGSVWVAKPAGGAGIRPPRRTASMRQPCQRALGYWSGNGLGESSDRAAASVRLRRCSNWVNGVGMVLRIADDQSGPSSSPRFRSLPSRPPAPLPSTRAFPVRLASNHRPDLARPDLGRSSRRIGEGNRGGRAW